jgi:glycosyltransferase involved in cell wall biosynthesis
LGLAGGAEVIGIVGRAHPMKDHATFFGAMARVIEARPQAHVLAVGSEVQSLGPVVERAMAPSLRARVQLLPERRRLEQFYPVLDLLCSTSLHGEGFPNVVAEAMACEVPCVVTDVGDAAAVAGVSGRVVPRSDPAAVADAVLAMLEAEPASRIERGRAAREHIVARFSIQSISARYQQLYESLVEKDEQH